MRFRASNQQRRPEQDQQAHCGTSTPAPQPLQPVETSPASIVPSDRGDHRYVAGRYRHEYAFVPRLDLRGPHHRAERFEIAAPIRRRFETSPNRRVRTRLGYALLTRARTARRAELDQQTGCTPSHGTEAPVTGWMNYSSTAVGRHVCSNKHFAGGILRRPPVSSAASLKRHFREAAQLAAMQLRQPVLAQHLHRLHADLQMLIHLRAIKLIGHAGQLQFAMQRLVRHA